MRNSIGNAYVERAIRVTGARRPTFIGQLPETYSEDGEDLVLESLLRVLCLREQTLLSRVFYLEIGGNHPIASSATYLLHCRYGCRGVIVEPNPELVGELIRVRADDIVVQAAVLPGMSERVTLYVSSIDEYSSILPLYGSSCGQTPRAEQVVPVEVQGIGIGELLNLYLPTNGINFMSIDVEGLELALLHGVDFERHRPTVLQVEPADHFDTGVGFRIIQHLEECGYRLHALTSLNQIYVDARRLP